MSSANHPTPGEDRRFLLLQGLMGRLFRRLGMRLAEAGYRVYKVNFNGGDRVFWRLPGGIDYVGTLGDWPQWLSKTINELAITDVVLFGDSRPHHALARKICSELGVPVHVFEEGYIRPDWVTLENGGVNANSSLPRDPDWYLRQAASLPPAADHQQVPSSFRRRATEAVVYNAADLLSRCYFKHWQHHRPLHPLVEMQGWISKLSRRKTRDKATAKLLYRLETHSPDYFLFPLQLDSDVQIREHSPYAGMEEAIHEVLTSFAAHAPADMRIILKEHPLDNGTSDWRAIVEAVASQLSIGGRVEYLYGGDIVPIAQKAKGMVLINSTSGTFALAMGVPVIALGEAIFDFPGLTHQGGLDTFWREPTAPDPALFDAFRRVLIDRVLIPGGFFSDEALAKVANHALARFEGRALPPE